MYSYEDIKDMCRGEKTRSGRRDEGGKVEEAI